MTEGLRSAVGACSYDVEVVGLLVSPVHRYGGRPGGVVPPQDGDRVQRVEVRAGHGIVGDRYAGRPAHRDASVTVLAAEAVEALAVELGSGPLDPMLARRNVVLRGAEVEARAGSCSPSTAGRARSCCRAVGRPTRAPGWTSPSRRAPTAACGAAGVSGAHR